MLYLSLSMLPTHPGSNEVGGPIFHRWLPDGIEDALTFSFDTPEDRLQVWFLRRGYMDDGFVRYEPDRFEVDEAMMRYQGWLDAGSLRGQATFSQISGSEMAAVISGNQGAKEYIHLGKRIIEFLRVPIQGFLDILRLKYGQHWLRELQPWDSRTSSLGGYCQSTFRLMWRESEADEWKPFLPDKPVHILSSEIGTGPGKRYAQFLTEEDWRHIQASISSISSLPIALRVAGRAHELAELGHVAEAYIQAATALELALNHFMSSRAPNPNKQTKAALSSFGALPLSQQLQLVALAGNLLPQATVKAALQAICTRNKIVHEASPLMNPPVQDLLELRRCSYLLLGVPDFKSPHLTSSNLLSPPDENA